MYMDPLSYVFHEGICIGNVVSFLIIICLFLDNFVANISSYWDNLFMLQVDVFYNLKSIVCSVPGGITIRKTFFNKNLTFCHTRPRGKTPPIGWPKRWLYSLTRPAHKLWQILPSTLTGMDYNSRNT